MLKVFDPTDHRNKKERIIIYGAPGIGKSRFTLRLTQRFGNILYFAADPNSQFLDSITPTQARRVVPVIQDGDDDITNFSEFCVHDWAAEEGLEMDGLPAWCNGKFPHIDTLVVDTYSHIMQCAIRQSANQGLAGTKAHYRVGEVGKGGQAIPTWDDYLGTEGLSRSLIEDMFSAQRDKNIIFVCHEDVKAVEGMPATGGPSHPGRKMLVDMPAVFSTVIRLIREKTLVPGDDAATNRVIAITDHDGKFIAKRRTGNDEETAILGRVVLDNDPINFWKLYDSIYAPQVQEEVVNG